MKRKKNLQELRGDEFSFLSSLLFFFFHVLLGYLIGTSVNHSLSRDFPQLPWFIYAMRRLFITNLRVRFIAEYLRIIVGIYRQTPIAIFFFTFFSCWTLWKIHHLYTGRFNTRKKKIIHIPIEETCMIFFFARVYSDWIKIVSARYILELCLELCEHIHEYMYVVMFSTFSRYWRSKVKATNHVIDVGARPNYTTVLLIVYLHRNLYIWMCAMSVSRIYSYILYKFVQYSTASISASVSSSRFLGRDNNFTANEIITVQLYTQKIKFKLINLKNNWDNILFH